jgi:glycosyl transferase family 25
MRSASVPTYLINLDRDVERLQNMAEQLHSLGMSFDRVPAILGTDMPDWLRPYFLREDGAIASELRHGEVGCYASHLMVMLRIACGQRPALVLEDDLKIHAEFPEILDAVDRLPAGWDIIRLSNDLKRGYAPVSKLSPKYQTVKFHRVPPSTGAYLITPKGAHKFLAWKGARRLPIDQDLRRIWECQLRTYGIYPQPILPNIGQSTILAMGGRANTPRKRDRSISGIAVSTWMNLRWLGPREWVRLKLHL